MALAAMRERDDEISSPATNADFRIGRNVRGVEGPEWSALDLQLAAGQEKKPPARSRRQEAPARRNR
jgi:hypothetical protein